MYFGKAQKQMVYSKQDLDDDDNENEEIRLANCKSSWLKHMLPGSDKESDAPGIKVRAIPGLEGVDYLTPGAFTSHISYVFGPVIKILEEKGYNSEDGKTNLMAAPYDWRLAPSAMEKRDEYFTKTMNSIEELYNNNDSTPVVLLCHSLGCKVAHYLLNFALDIRGQSWIDKYVHTYMVSCYLVLSKRVIRMDVTANDLEGKSSNLIKFSPSTYDKAGWRSSSWCTQKHARTYFRP